MLLNAICTKKTQPHPWLVWALILWSICLLVVSIRLMVVEPGRRSLYPIYDWAGKTSPRGRTFTRTRRRVSAFRFTATVPALQP